LSSSSSSSDALPVLDISPSPSTCQIIETTCGQVGFTETPRSHIHALEGAFDPTSVYQLSSCKNCSDILEPSLGLTLSYDMDHMDELLFVGATVSIPDRIKIALRLVHTVLNFHNTPWLPDGWQLQDLSLPAPLTNSLDITTILKSLHLAAEFNNRIIPLPDSPMPDPSVSPSSEITANITEPTDLRVIYGVNNTVLFSLGVALLQIGHWKSLSSLQSVRHRKENEPPWLIARRVLNSGQSPLGSKYQQIVEQCFQCNFGHGDDLEKPELQAAVYTDVVCKLEGMMKVLSV